MKDTHESLGLAKTSTRDMMIQENMQWCELMKRNARIMLGCLPTGSHSPRMIYLHPQFETELWVLLFHHMMVSFSALMATFSSFLHRVRIYAYTYLWDGRVELFILHECLGTLGSLMIFFVFSFLWKNTRRSRWLMCPVYSTLNKTRVIPKIASGNID